MAIFHSYVKLPEGKWLKFRAKTARISQENPVKSGFHQGCDWHKDHIHLDEHCENYENP